MRTPTIRYMGTHVTLHVAPRPTHDGKPRAFSARPRKTVCGHPSRCISWTPTFMAGCPQSFGRSRHRLGIHEVLWSPMIMRGHQGSLVDAHKPHRSRPVSSICVHVVCQSTSNTLPRKSTSNAHLCPVSSMILVHVSPRATTSHVHIRPSPAHVCPSASMLPAHTRPRMTTIGDHSRPMLTHAYPRCQPTHDHYAPIFELVGIHNADTWKPTYCEWEVTHSSCTPT